MNTNMVGFEMFQQLLVGVPLMKVASALKGLGDIIPLKCSILQIQLIADCRCE